eukprot:TRINITY_DN1447_c0_g1_i4.p1 TRINITY_DN1447_c0_g1~~TRINITY_DN1447_c0_g1_i4.p1  ORF type:complete len:162 (+),score=44.89 TRINITY_DN1447_c0_g1_i4:587-1072(+)
MLRHAENFIELIRADYNTSTLLPSETAVTAVFCAVDRLLDWNLVCQVRRAIEGLNIANMAATMDARRAVYVKLKHLQPEYVAKIEEMEKSEQSTDEIEQFMEENDEKIMQGCLSQGSIETALPSVEDLRENNGAIINTPKTPFKSPTTMEEEDIVDVTNCV